MKSEVKIFSLNILKRYYFDKFAYGDKSVKYKHHNMEWSKDNIQTFINPQEKLQWTNQIDSIEIQEILSELENEGYIIFKPTESSKYVTFIGVPPDDSSSVLMNYGDELKK
ncbi:MAG: hypothetical protein HQK53_18960 [Oligoflexia bacterium]|nr:hypothetical protein [Oligoflexia bacterium]